MPVTIKFTNTANCPQQAQIISDATPFNDGVMTKEQVRKLNSLASSGVPVYASLGDFPSATVSDETQAFADDTQTLYLAEGGVWIPVGQRSAVYDGDSVVYVATDGTAGRPGDSVTLGTISDPIDLASVNGFEPRPFSSLKNRFIYAAGDYSIDMLTLDANTPIGGTEAEPMAHIGGYSTVLALGDRTVDSFSGQTISDDGGDDPLNLPLNSYAGAWVRFTSGTNNGARFAIRTNQGHTFTLLWNNDYGLGAPSHGDSYVVERCNVVITCNEAFEVSGTGTGAFGVTFAMVGIHIIAPSFSFRGAGLQYVIEGCTLEVTGGGFFNIGAGVQLSGADLFNDVVPDSGVATSITAAAATSLLGADVVNSYAAVLSQYWMFVDCIMDKLESANLYLPVFNLRGGSGLVLSQYSSFLSGFGLLFPNRIESTLGSGLSLDTGSVAGQLTLIDISNCTQDALAVAGGSYMDVDGTVTGTGNGGFGLNATEASTVAISGTLTATGTDGNVQVGNCAVTTYADLATLGAQADQFSGDGSRVFIDATALAPQKFNNGATLPTAALVAGTAWLLSTTHKLLIWDGAGNWRDTAGAIVVTP